MRRAGATVLRPCSSFCKHHQHHHHERSTCVNSYHSAPATRAPHAQPASAPNTGQLYPTSAPPFPSSPSSNNPPYPQTPFPPPSTLNVSPRVIEFTPLMNLTASSVPVVPFRSALFQDMMLQVSQAKEQHARNEIKRRSDASGLKFAEQLKLILDRADANDKRAQARKRRQQLNNVKFITKEYLDKGYADPFRRGTSQQQNDTMNDTSMMTEQQSSTQQTAWLQQSTSSSSAASSALRVEVAPRQTVGRLAGQMGVSGKQILEKLADLDHRAKKLTDFLNAEVAELIVSEFGMLPVKTTDLNKSTDISTEQDKRRGPVVCVMGHVDHGKTTLLDTLRREQRALYEAGNITQAIGAFRVDLSQTEDNKNDKSTDSSSSVSTTTANPFAGTGPTAEDLKSIDAAASIATFLDTPGHAAFRAMRQRGANASCTDLIVLVISAVDGVQPQTVEVIELAAKHQVPMIIAINKCDLPTANPQKVREQLCMYDVITEQMGGEVLSIEISAKFGHGIKELKEAVLLASDMLDLRAPDTGEASAYVIESRRERNLGCVINLVVRKGELKVGDFFVCGLQHGPIRALIDERGNKLESAKPSQGVQLLGAGQLQDMAEELISVANEEAALKLVESRRTVIEGGVMEAEEAIADDEAAEPKEEAYKVKVARSKRFRVAVRPLTPEQQAEQQHKEDSTISLIIKADVNGSLQALTDYINQLPNDEVTVTILRSDLGEINDADIIYADQMNASIVGFNVSISSTAALLAKHKEVSVSSKDVIYYVMDEIRDLASVKLPVLMETRVLGTAEVAQVFPQHSRRSTDPPRAVAGCRVLSGELKHDCMYRVKRDGAVIYTGSLSSMRHFTKNITTCLKGNECGIQLESFSECQVGDVLECIQDVRVDRVLDDSAARGFETVLNPKYDLSNVDVNDMIKRKKREARELIGDSTMTYTPQAVRDKQRGAMNQAA